VHRAAPHQRVRPSAAPHQRRARLPPGVPATCARGEEILIYGDGRQRRDCLHVDDVIAALLASVDDRAVGHVFNVGHPSTYALHEIASTIVAAAGSTGGVRLVPWPDDHARIDIGSFHTGSARIAEVLGWRAAIELDAGIRDTIAFYREHACYLSST
jgi:UDP-glucose 4-epimerase